MDPIKGEQLLECFDRGRDLLAGQGEALGAIVDLEDFDEHSHTLAHAGIEIDRAEGREPCMTYRIAFASGFAVALAVMETRLGIDLTQTGGPGNG